METVTMALDLLGLIVGFLMLLLPLAALWGAGRGAAKSKPQSNTAEAIWALLSVVGLFGLVMMIVSLGHGFYVGVT